MNALTYTLPRRATRTLRIAFISVSKSQLVGLCFESKTCKIAFHTVMPLNCAAIQAFTDKDGKIDRLLELERSDPKFHFVDFIGDGYLDSTHIARIKQKSKVTA